MISSLCTIANKHAVKELRVLVKSFRLWHPDIPIIVGCDTEAGKEAERLGVTPLRVIPDTMTPQQNCSEWVKLMLKKTEAMDCALSDYPDTLFVDADMLFVAPVSGINMEEREVALSPHYIRREDEKQYGRYNGGYVWTSEQSFPQWWRDATPRFKYYEQQCLVYAAETYAIQDLPPNHNYSWWRLDQVEKAERKKRRVLFQTQGKKIWYDKWPLVSVHTHIFSKDQKFVSINGMVRKLLGQSKSEKHKNILNWIA